MKTRGNSAMTVNDCEGLQTIIERERDEEGLEGK
ncbi:hypothetical protein ES702_03207 [subsurface metagenome]